LEPALAEVAVEVDPALRVFAALAVAVVVLVLHDHHVALLFGLFILPHPDHDPGVLVVYDKAAVGVLVPEGGDLAVAVEVVPAVLVDAAVAVIVLVHAVLSLRDALLQAVKHTIRVDDGEEVERLVVNQTRDRVIRAVTRNQLVDGVKAHLRAREFVAVGGTRDQMPRLALVGLPGRHVLHALLAHVAQGHMRVDRGPGLHIGDDQQVDGPPHGALADLQELGYVGIGPGHILQVFRREAVAVVPVEIDGYLLRGLGIDSTEQECTDSDARHTELPGGRGSHGQTSLQVLA